MAEGDTEIEVSSEDDDVVRFAPDAHGLGTDASNVQFEIASVSNSIEQPLGLEFEEPHDDVVRFVPDAPGLGTDACHVQFEIASVSNSIEQPLGLEFEEATPDQRALKIKGIRPEGSIAAWNKEQHLTSVERRRRIAADLPIVEVGDYIVRLVVGASIETPLHWAAPNLRSVIEVPRERIGLVLARKRKFLHLVTKRRRRDARAPATPQAFEDIRSPFESLPMSESTMPSSASMSVPSVDRWHVDDAAEQEQHLQFQ